MNNFSLKDGWHPKGKDGSKESWRGDFKGINQVVSDLLCLCKAPLIRQAGWMGKGKDTTSSSSSDRSNHSSKLSSLKNPAGLLGRGNDTTPSSDRSNHVSQPLSSLKNPASFGPPPRHANYYGAAAVSDQPSADRQAPPSQHQVYAQDVHQQPAMETGAETTQKPPPPPVPYRANTTGLTTNDLPPPPVRRLDSPSSASPTTSKPKPPVPQPPPRLPARNESPSVQTPPPPPYSAVASPPSQEYINQGATSRLSNAGVSVPALGIGERGGPSQASNDAPVNNLSSRFSQMRTNIGSSTAPAPPARGTQTNADADSTLPPLPTFRERHADKIDMGKQKLGGVTSRLNTFVEDRKFSANANKRMPRPPSTYSSAPAPAPAPAPASPISPALSSPTSPDVQTQAQRKKPPPPPPPKRAEIRAAPTSGSSSPAPPLPLNTKPR